MTPTIDGVAYPLAVPVSDAARTLFEHWSEHPDLDEVIDHLCTGDFPSGTSCSSRTTAPCTLRTSPGAPLPLPVTAA